jgi:hypothetical protein
MSAGEDVIYGNTVMQTEISEHTPPLTKADIEVKPLVDLWSHQNTLMWSRVQLLSALQGAALVGNYALKNPFASLGICLLAILSTLYLNSIWEVDRLIRDSYKDRLALLGFKVSLEREEREVLQVRVMGFRILTHYHARISLLVIFWGMVALDLVVLVASLAVFKSG